jgi:hypothetical protein
MLESRGGFLSPVTALTARRVRHLPVQPSARYKDALVPRRFFNNSLSLPLFHVIIFSLTLHLPARPPRSCLRPLRAPLTPCHPPLVPAREKYRCSSVESRKRDISASNDGEIGSVAGGDVSHLGRARAKASLSHIDSWEEEVVSVLTQLHWETKLHSTAEADSILTSRRKRDVMGVRERSSREGIQQRRCHRQPEGNPVLRRARQAAME